MTIEEKRGSMGRDEGHGDQFPIGMRVLAVDDDPICLKVLETLLLRCLYHVTTTNQAIKALSLLRENKDKFDLVISDVHMPDMDGFKLLEFVGLEMDLPVIMLSANGETKAVMKGITHGACDYLLKPVRIEELKNIWQHVVRRRKLDHKDRCSFENGEDHDKSYTANSEGMQAIGANGPSDYCSRVCKKRKDQNDEDEDNCEENTLESEDPSSQKKPRVIWSVELHRKFVAAVNQLGIDKAVPKRILDLMNVEKLTRENVASHLQKYRLYLKRLSSVASQQANMAAALGGRDASSYLHMGSFNGFGNFHGISSIGPLQGFTTFQPSGFSSSPNPNLLGLPGLTSGIIQIGNTQNSTNNIMIDLCKFQHIVAPSNQHENLLQGIPSSLELDQLQLKQKRISEPNNRLPEVFFSAANGSRSLPGHQQKAQPRGLGNQSSAAVLPPIGSDLRSDPSLSGYNTNTLPIGPPYSNENIISSNTAESLSSTVPHFSGNPLNISSNNLLATSQDSLMGMPSGVDADHKLLNFRNLVNLKQKLENSEQQNAIEPKVALNSSLISSMLPNRTLLNTVADSQKSHSRIYNKAITSMMSQQSLDTAFMSQHAKVIKSFDDSWIAYNEENLLGTSKMQGGFGSSNCNFDELMNAMIKPERDDNVFVDGEIGSDLFSLSTCM